MKVAKRINEIVNRLNKTKKEEYPNLQGTPCPCCGTDYDFSALKEARDAAERAEKKKEIQRAKATEEEAKAFTKAQTELRHYTALMAQDVSLRTSVLFFFYTLKLQFH